MNVQESTRTQPKRHGERGRIVVDPAILAGKPVIEGTRIPVSLILNLLDQGYSVDRIVEAYPVLTADAIQAAVRYAEASADREEVRSAPSR